MTSANSGVFMCLMVKPDPLAAESLPALRVGSPVEA